MLVNGQVDPGSAQWRENPLAVGRNGAACYSRVVSEHVFEHCFQRFRLCKRFSEAPRLRQLERVGLAASLVILAGLAAGFPLVLPYLAVSILAAIVRIAASLREEPGDGR